MCVICDKQHLAVTVCYNLKVRHDGRRTRFLGTAWGDSIVSRKCPSASSRSASGCREERVFFDLQLRHLLTTSSVTHLLALFIVTNMSQLPLNASEISSGDQDSCILTWLQIYVHIVKRILGLTGSTYHTVGTRVRKANAHRSASTLTTLTTTTCLLSADSLMVSVSVLGLLLQRVRMAAQGMDRRIQMILLLPNNCIRYSC